MFRWLMLLSLLLWACVEETPGQTGSAPLPAGASAPPVSAEDLSGAWVFGDGSPPAPGPVETCLPLQTLTLYEQGDAIHGDVQTCSRRCEPPDDCTGACKTLEAFEGVNRAGEVTLSGKFQGNQGDQGEPVTYALRFDPETRHLVGTRNGRAFWAAPWAKPPARRCRD